MPQWASISSRMPKPVLEPQHSTVTSNTRAEGFHSTSRGGVVPTNDSGGPEIPARSMAAPGIKTPNLSYPQGRIPQGPGGTHPSRMRNTPHRQRRQSNKWLKRAMHSGSTKFTLDSNNNTRLPVNTPTAPATTRSVPTSYNTGPGHNMPVPAFILTDPRAKSPPKAPKAMTSQGGSAGAPTTGRFNPIQGGKQPPTGPKADKTPQNSPKGPKGQYGTAGRTRASSHSNNNPKRKKYVSGKKSRSLRDSFGVSPTGCNAGPSNTPQAMRPALRKSHMRGSIPMAKHVLPPKIQSSNNNKGKNLPPGKASGPHSNHDVPESFPQSRCSQLNSNPTNPLDFANSFNNLAAVIRCNPKHSAATPLRDSPQPPPQDENTPEPTNQDVSPWEGYYRTPMETRYNVEGTGDISLEHDHQVHPARLNHFNNNYSTPSPEPTRYLSPPTKKSNRNIYSGYKDGDIIAGTACKLPTTNRGRVMLEKMGYTPGTSLGKSGKKETELAVVMMKTGRGGLGGGEPKEVRSYEHSAAIVAAPSNGQDLSQEPLILKYSGYRSEKALRAGRTGGNSVQDNVHELDILNRGSTKERVVITIDSDDEESIHKVSQQERREGGQGGCQEEEEEEEEDQDMQEMWESQHPGLGAEPEVIAIKDDAEDSSKDGYQDMDRGDIHDCMVDGSRSRSYSPQFERTPTPSLPRDFDKGDIHDCMVDGSRSSSYSPQLEQTPTAFLPRDFDTKNSISSSTNERSGDTDVVQRDSSGEGAGEDLQNQESRTCEESGEVVSRWKLPPFQCYAGSFRPTVPMQLFDFLIIERLEQIALGEIFQCINSFEEESRRLTGPAFNYLLVRSFSRVRDMFMYDPLRGVDQETCEEVAREEFGALLVHLAASSC